MENDKITDNAGDSTVTTEKDKGTTFGKAGSPDTTNIYGDSIKTGTINAKDTTTDKLTAWCSCWRRRWTADCRC